MQWNNQANAGFSQVDPWLPVNSNFTERNVQQQSSDPQSLLAFFKKLIQIRKTEPALQQGDFTPLVDEPRQILAFLRQLKQDQILVILNFSSRTLTFDLPDGAWDSLLDDLSEVSESVKLEPYQVVISKLKD